MSKQPITTGMNPALYLFLGVTIAVAGIASWLAFLTVSALTQRWNIALIAAIPDSILVILGAAFLVAWNRTKPK